MMMMIMMMMMMIIIIIIIIIIITTVITDYLTLHSSRNFAFSLAWFCMLRACARCQGLARIIFNDETILCHLASMGLAWLDFVIDLGVVLCCALSEMVLNNCSIVLCITR